MSAQNVEERILKVISNAVPAAYKKAKIRPDSVLQRDLGLDSLAVAFLVFKFEEEFGIELDGLEEEVDMAGLRTVSDILRVGKEVVEKAGGK